MLTVGFRFGFFFPITQNSQFDTELYHKSQEIKIRKLNHDKINMKLAEPWIENGVTELQIGFLLQKVLEKKTKSYTEKPQNVPFPWPSAIRTWLPSCSIVRGEKNNCSNRTCKEKKNPLTSLKSCFTPPSPQAVYVPPYHILKLCPGTNLSCKAWWFMESKRKLQLSKETRENRLSNGLQPESFS